MTCRGQTRRTRILFFGEGATLAHVARPLELASRMDSERYDVFFACDDRYAGLARARRLRRVSIASIPSETFVRRVYAARPLYTENELKQYVIDDIRAIIEVDPDVVVGDFRLSLGISAELCGKPHLALSNAHWSPSCALPCPVPEHPLVRCFGVKLMRWIMRFTLPLFFGIQARAFNRLRKIYGLEPIRGRGAQEVFTRGNHTLYLDIPELYDLGPLSASESYIGPVNWAMDTPLPRWWKRLPADKPVVFVSPGSSGDTRGTLRILQTLAGTDVTLVVATAGRLDRDALPEDAFVADFIPAPDVVKRADLVICNGGCAMVYQALAQGKPVLGIPSNIDQYYTMEAIERKGAGKLIRAGMADPDAVRLAVDTILAEPSYRQAAGTLQTHIQKLDTVKLFSEAVERTVGGFGGATATADGEATAEEIASCPDFAVSNS